MIVFVFNFILLLFYALTINPKRTKARRRLFCFLFGFQWTIISGFRTDIFSDTVEYHRTFLEYAHTDLESLVNSIIPQILFQNPLIEEPGIRLLEKAVYLIGGDYRFLLLIVAFFVSFSLAYFIYDNSKNPLWGCLIYSSIFFPFLSMSALRQSIAISLVTFFGFSAVKRKKYFLFVILLSIAILFHKSAVFGLLIPIAFHLKTNRSMYYIGGLLFLLLLGFHTQILIITSPLIGYDNYIDSNYVGSRSLFYLSAYLLIWILYALRKPVIESAMKHYDVYYVMFTIGVLFCAFSFDNSNAFRISFYYSFSMFFLVENMIESCPVRMRMLISFLMVSSCIVALCGLSTTILHLPISTPISDCFSL